MIFSASRCRSREFCEDVETGRLPPSAGGLFSKKLPYLWSGDKTDPFESLMTLAPTSDAYIHTCAHAPDKPGRQVTIWYIPRYRTTIPYLWTAKYPVLLLSLKKALVFISHTHMHTHVRSDEHLRIYTYHTCDTAKAIITVGTVIFECL